ncbi:outer membrane protein assembly factor BamB family protein [Halorussus litoreus]|uniref:outer membrane protein assembly factor BamB family protein n=1 Tax=Halorussus litoreus TaxID=1710536 RepID=UPI000E2535B0|nr:PQQ-binding-like beta-propeller repeat protein [Halorussus litoreus]
MVPERSPSLLDLPSGRLDLSRRQLLGGLGLATAGVAGATTQMGVGPVDGWTPSFGTWPHDRYGPGNAAANRHANAPDEPTVAWRTQPVGQVESIVVGPERVYVGGEVRRDGRHPGVAALDRADGDVLWTANTGGATLALRRGSLYAAAYWGESQELVALDAATGDRQWGSSVESVRGLVVADGTVFAGSHYRLTALDADSGRTLWTGDGGLPAVADSSLFVSGGGLRRHRQRRVSDVLTHGPPPVEWNVSGGGGLVSPAVASDVAVVGQRRPPRSDDPSVYAFDLDTGERAWTAATPPEDAFPVLTCSPAVGRRRGFFSYRERQGSDRYHALVACSLDDGAEQWRWESSDWVTEVAVGGETVLAGTGADSDTPGEGRSRLLGFTPGGDRKWSFETDYDVRAVAPVAETVFVGTTPDDDEGGPGVVYALR